MARLSRLLGAVSLGVAMTAAVAAVGLAGAEYSPHRHSPVARNEAGQSARIIVKFKDKAKTLAAATASARLGPQSAAVLGKRLGLSLADGRILGPRTQVLTSPMLNSAVLAARVAQDADVEWAEVDHRRYAQAAPNDPLYPLNPVDANGNPTTPVSGQWYLRAPAGAVKSGVDIEPAWAITQGSSAMVVAVVDTGITSHPDLVNKMLAGYDFIADVPTANDGDARDSSPADPGDWITSAEDASGDFKGCGTSDSSWHGTQVAGIVGAQTNNGIGMAGTAPNVKVLPVRVLGKCGGYDSDILAGIQWAAGIAVAGAPANPTPARVVNLSLGGTGSCTSAYSDVFAQLTSMRVVVVAAAGNDEGLAVETPANCPGVVGVAGLRHTGTKVAFSDIGPELTIAAPGGNCVNTGLADPCLYPILTTINSGTTTPGSAIYSNAYNPVSLGTSFSAPIVSGTVALMLSAAPALTNSQVISTLKSTANVFPTTSDSADVPVCTAPMGTTVQDECICTTSTCGAGMLNAGAAVQAAALLAPTTPVAVISGGNTVVRGGSLQLSGASSTAPAPDTIVAYRWQIISGGTFASFSTDVTAPTVTVVGVAAGAATVQLTVTDTSGTTASTAQAVTVTAPASGGGGGATNPAWLAGLLLAGWLLAPRRRILARQKR